MMKRLLIVLVGVGLCVFSVAVAMAQVPFLDYGEVAQKVTVNPEGRGDCLIFPFYDVREAGGKAQTTNFVIINTDPLHGVAARVWFREWGRGANVLDFDVWLSANGVWSGRLERNPNTGITTIFSSSNIISEFDNTTLTVSNLLQNGFDFITLLVVPPIQGLSKADMTLMGFFEVIGTEKTAPESSNGIVTRITGPGWDCGNTLSGYAYLTREPEGITMAYNATALANFSRQEDTRLLASPALSVPNLKNCEDGLDQLEFELSKAQVYAGYNIEEKLGAKYSLVITFPTKHFHFTGNPSDLPPFTGTSVNQGEPIDVSIYDRSENLFKQPTKSTTLPYEVNVIGIYQKPPVLPNKLDRNNIGFQSGGFEDGWILIDLYAGIHEKNGIYRHLGHLFGEYLGIPALGLSLQEFQQGNKGKFYGGQILPVFHREQWLPLLQ